MPADSKSCGEQSSSVYSWFAGSVLSERRNYGSGYGGNTDHPTASAAYQMPSTLQLHFQPRTSFTELATEPSPVYAESGRYSDPTQQRTSAAQNRPITDTDKLQQWGHENLTGGGSYRSDSYRGDHRVPSRFLADELVDAGRYPAERSSAGPQPHFHSDTSSSAYNRRRQWSSETSQETSRPQYYPQVSSVPLGVFSNLNCKCVSEVLITSHKQPCDIVMVVCHERSIVCVCWLEGWMFWEV